MRLSDDETPRPGGWSSTVGEALAIIGDNEDELPQENNRKKTGQPGRTSRSHEGLKRRPHQGCR